MLLETVVLTLEGGDALIIHAMPARTSTETSLPDARALAPPAHFLNAVHSGVHGAASDRSNGGRVADLTDH